MADTINPVPIVPPRHAPRLRGLARRFLTHPVVLEGAASLSGGHATICFLHRFSETEDDSGAFPIEALRTHLQWLRAHRYRLTSLGTLLVGLREGRPIPPRTVVFTIDDGFADFRELARPVFAEFDCPTTVFLVTDFIDHRSWLWWNRIEHGFQETSLDRCRLEVGPLSVEHRWRGARERRSVAERVTEELKWLDAATRNAAIDRLLGELEVDIPLEATADFAPMTWPEIRGLNGDLVSFGPHTVTHPILSLESDERARREIVQSWQRLEVEVPDAVPAFCFPNGDPLSFGQRELMVLAEAGPLASLSTTPRSVSERTDLPGNLRLFDPLPRIQLESDFARFAQVVSGVDRLKGWFRPRP